MKFLEQDTYGFEYLESHESKTSNRWHFEVEMKKIWLIEARLRKEHDNTMMLNSIQNWGYLP